MQEKIIKVYTGQNICGNTNNPQIFQFHPVFEVEYANRIIREFNDRNQDRLIFYSNSPDFISGIYYISKKNNIPVELYLDGIVSTIEDIFADFNKSYDILTKFIE